MKILICEDEPVTAARIERLARANIIVTDIQVAATGEQARDILRSSTVELAFLDINLPDMTGFEVAHHALDIGVHVVFITAYDEHAVRAFDVGAVDYLLKPVEAARFDEALARAQSKADMNLKARRTEELGRMVRELRKERRDGKFVYDFWIKDRDWRIRVPIEQVRYMEAARDYVILHTSERQHMIRRTMSEIERQVDPNLFLRIHRSYFVNLKEIQSVVSGDGRPQAVELKSGQEVPIGPAYQGALRLALRTLPA
ncbi:MAG: LytTR family DNA-binding domain-containing protein [Pseudomonadota bacterium]